jgi:hypothetical protein
MHSYFTLTNKRNLLFPAMPTCCEKPEEFSNLNIGSEPEERQLTEIHALVTHFGIKINL